MTNPELASQLRAQADDLMSQRAALLTASVALATTATSSAAIKALRDVPRPGVRDAAIALIENPKETP